MTPTPNLNAVIINLKLLLGQRLLLGVGLLKKGTFSAGDATNYGLTAEESRALCALFVAAGACLYSDDYTVDGERVVCVIGDLHASHCGERIGRYLAEQLQNPEYSVELLVWQAGYSNDRLRGVRLTPPLNRVWRDGCAAAERDPNHDL